MGAQLSQSAVIGAIDQLAALAVGRLSLTFQLFAYKLHNSVQKAGTSDGYDNLGVVAGGVSRSCVCVRGRYLYINVCTPALTAIFVGFPASKAQH